MKFATISTPLRLSKPLYNMITIHEPIDPGEFKTRYLRKGVPVLMKGAAFDWPAVGRWTPRFFREKYPDVEISVERSRVDVNKEDDPATFFRLQSTEKWKLGDYARFLEDAATSTDHYCAGYRILQAIPELESDLGQIDKYMTLPKYLPRNIRAKCRGSAALWMGGAGTRSPLHFDRQDNFAVMLHGKKRWMFFPPGTEGLYYPSSRMMTSTMHFSPVNVNNPNPDRFPLYDSAKAIAVDLEEGDILYNPPGWWHYVSSPANSVMLNFFWLRPATNIWKLKAFYLYRFRRKFLCRLGLSKFASKLERQHD